MRRANVTCRIVVAKWIDNLATVDTGGGGVGSVGSEGLSYPSPSLFLLVAASFKI